MPFYQNPYINQNFVPSTYPSLSAFPSATSGWNILERFDATPYLCQLLKIANIPEVDPVIRIENENGFDYEHYLDSFYAQLSSMRSDLRISFGDVWNEVSTVFLPRSLTQIEIAQAGGCQVIDNYICNADGIKIKEASSTCKEGEEFLKPISSQEITDFVTNYIQETYNDFSDGFIDYIIKTYRSQGWTIKLIFYSRIYFFYVEASKITTRVVDGVNTQFTDKKFFKYYQDSKEYISEKMAIPIIVNEGFVFDEEPYNYVELSEAIALDPIPDYRLL
jgi:hypothetical protein